MPASAPGSVTARTTKTTRMAKSASIITLVMRSTPFCRPMRQMRMATRQATSIHPINSAGFASMASKIPAICSDEAFSNMPDAIFGT